MIVYEVKKLVITTLSCFMENVYFSQTLIIIISASKAPRDLLQTRKCRDFYCLSDYEIKSIVNGRKKPKIVPNAFTSNVRQTTSDMT